MDMDIGLKDVVALLLAVGGYALWYRLDVGPWCPAMWHGTLPPLAIGLGYLTLRRLFNVLRQSNDV